MSEMGQPRSEDEDEEHLKETSVLFEPFMIWCLAVLLLLAIWFKFLPLIVVASFLLVLSMVIFKWKEQSLKKLELELNISNSRLFAEEEFIVDASIKNNKWLPLIWLEWEFPSSDVIVWGESWKNTYIIRFLWLLSYQQISWTVKGTGLKRGVYNIGEVTTRSGDGFRFSEKEKKYNLKRNLYIYPKLIPVQVPAFQASMQWEVKGKQGGFLEDPLLVSGIRDYVAGDEWQRLNFRASARMGKMQTNIYQRVVSEQLIIYVDVQGFVINKEKYVADQEKQLEYVIQKKASFESLLSVVASFAMAYHERGISVGYRSNGLNHLGEKQQQLPPRMEITNVMDQLAQIIPYVAMQKVTVLDEISYGGKSTVPLFIFCEKITNGHYQWYERNKDKLDIRFYYIWSNTFSVKLTNVAKQIDCLLTSVVVREL